MAGTPITIRSRGAHADTSEHCILEIAANANVGVELRGLEYSEGGTSGTAARTRLRSTIGGTASDGTEGSEATVSHGNPLNSHSIQTTARGVFTSNPSTTGEATGPFGGEADPQRGLAKWTGYQIIPPGKTFRVYATAGATNNFTLNANCEE